LTILLVDDAPLTLEALRRLLERAGHSVVGFTTGGQALDWLADHRPDAIILDIVMPQISGYEVCRRLRLMPPLRRLPVLFLTSKNGTADRVQAEAAGSDLFVSKPVLAARLLEQLSDIRRQIEREGPAA
jgi:CheY-like chemotaxis protein